MFFRYFDPPEALKVMAADPSWHSGKLNSYPKGMCYVVSHRPKSGEIDSRHCTKRGLNFITYPMHT